MASFPKAAQNGEDMRHRTHETCELLPNCRFFKIHSALGERESQDLINLYCRGGEDMECLRKRFAQATGRTPPDGMLPTGQMLPAPCSGKAETPPSQPADSSSPASPGARPRG